RSEQAEKYQYNGKEWNDALGLNIYEMDLRQYDPAIGRWMVQDPVVHHEFSPYSAFDNNPVYWADPSGANSIQYDWGSGMYNVLGNNGDVLGIIEPGDFNLSQYLNNPDSYITSVLYSMDTSFDGTGNGGGSGGGSGGLGNGNGGGNGNGNGGGKREEYRPTFREIYSVIANNSNFPMGVVVNMFNLNMSMLTGKDRHLYGPDAIVLTKDVTGGAIGWGVIVFMRGSLEGKAYLLGDYGVGISTVDISTGFTVQGLYYS